MNANPALSGFAVLLVVVTFVPPFISVCSAFHAFHGAMKQMEPDSSKAVSYTHLTLPTKRIV